MFADEDLGKPKATLCLAPHILMHSAWRQR